MAVAQSKPTNGEAAQRQTLAFNNLISWKKKKETFIQFSEPFAFFQWGETLFESLTNLSMWAALNTTSNSELSSSAALSAIWAASPRRDCSSRNWPAGGGGQKKVLIVTACRSSV